VQKFDPITPDDIAPMSMSFVEFLADYSDTISTATVTASPAGLTILQVAHTANTVSFVASQGAVGTYALTFAITTAGGAEWHRQAGLTVKAGI
jgi:hypothetical protein